MGHNKSISAFAIGVFPIADANVETIFELAKY